MREADRRCIEVIGIPGAVLMNNAGAAVYAHVRGSRIAVVCGKGNNGGDGYVVARLALLDDVDVEVIVLANPEDIKGDAAVFRDAYTKLGGPITYMTDEAEIADAITKFADRDMIVDAILGTGVDGEVRGVAAAAINSWPEEPATVAVDIPSGLNADTGEPCGMAIRADTTVTFQFPKLGFRAQSAKHYLGELIVANIGIPRICADDEAWREQFPHSAG